jgi:hypothetical protein
MKYCLCQSFTGSAEVSSRSRLPPLTLVSLWNKLHRAAKEDWASKVQAHEQPRKYLSTRLIYACDIDRWCFGNKEARGVVCHLPLHLLYEGQTRPVWAATVLSSLPRTCGFARLFQNGSGEP